MAPTKVLNCFHGQALSFEYSQYVQLAEVRALREITSSGSLKKSSFFKKNFVLYLTIILLIVLAIRMSNVVLKKAVNFRTVLLLMVKIVGNKDFH